MFYRFAEGDSESRIIRPKVALIFLRYAIFFIFILLQIILKLNWIFYLICLMIILYILWSIIKNYKYVNNVRAIFYLPLLQITSDIAVIFGTIAGI
jgi:hypothetical protein